MYVCSVSSLSYLFFNSVLFHSAVLLWIFILLVLMLSLLMLLQILWLPSMHDTIKSQRHALLSFKPSGTAPETTAGIIFSVNQQSLCFINQLAYIYLIISQVSHISGSWPQWYHEKLSSLLIHFCLAKQFFFYVSFSTSHIIAFALVFFTYFSSEYFPSLTCSKGFCNLFISSCEKEKKYLTN